jgi:hypothetical protein
MHHIEVALKQRREAKANTPFDLDKIEKQHAYINSPQYYFSISSMGSANQKVLMDETDVQHTA